MQKIKKERGITLITLVITAVVLLLISTPIVVRTTKLTETKKYTNFRDDMLKLKEDISILYDLDEDISEIGPVYTGDKAFLIDEVKSPNDQEPYYVIDFSKLANKYKSKYGLDIGEFKVETENANLGEASESSSNNVYIINSKSRTIYYNKGIQYNNQTFYRLNENLSNTPQITMQASSLELYIDGVKAESNVPIEIELEEADLSDSDYKNAFPVITFRRAGAIMETYKPAEDLNIKGVGEYTITYKSKTHEEGTAQLEVTVKVTVK